MSTNFRKKRSRSDIEVLKFAVMSKACSSWSEVDRHLTMTKLVDSWDDEEFEEIMTWLLAADFTTSRDEFERLMILKCFSIMNKCDLEDMLNLLTFESSSFIKRILIDVSLIEVFQRLERKKLKVKKISLHGSSLQQCLDMEAADEDSGETSLPATESAIPVDNR